MKKNINDKKEVIEMITPVFFSDNMFVPHDYGLALTPNDKYNSLYGVFYENLPSIDEVNGMSKIELLNYKNGLGNIWAERVKFVIRTILTDFLVEIKQIINNNNKSSISFPNEYDDDIDIFLRTSVYSFISELGFKFDYRYPFDDLYNGSVTQRDEVNPLVIINDNVNAGIMIIYNNFYNLIMNKIIYNTGVETYVENDIILLEFMKLRDCLCDAVVQLEMERKFLFEEASNIDSVDNKYNWRSISLEDSLKNISKYGY